MCPGHPVSSHTAHQMRHGSSREALGSMGERRWPAGQALDRVHLARAAPRAVRASRAQGACLLQPTLCVHSPLRGAVTLRSSSWMWTRWRVWGASSRRGAVTSTPPLSSRHVAHMEGHCTAVDAVFVRRAACACWYAASAPDNSACQRSCAHGPVLCATCTGVFASWLPGPRHISGTCRCRGRAAA